MRLGLRMEEKCEVESENTSKKPEIELDSYRWVIVAIFAAYCGTNFFLFMQFTIIANITEKYYNVDSFLTDTTGLVFMATYIIFFVPVGRFIEKKDLRQTSLISTAITAFGNMIKLFAVSPDRFYLIILSQIICGIGQVFMISLPPKVASTWFGAEEVSLACAIGIMGCQIGLALGTLISSSLVPDSTNMQQVADGFSDLYNLDNVMSITMLILVILFFRSEPSSPPSHAQANRLDATEDIGYMEAFRGFMKSRDYRLVLVCFGMSFGVWNCLGIIVNEMFLHFFPADGKYLGFLIFCGILAGGVVATVLFGYILDRTHAFKRISNVALLVFFFFWVCLTIAFQLRSFLWTAILMPVNGFFGGSLIVIGYEYGTEITYPVPESFSASLLNAAIYLFAMVDVLVIECVFKTIGFFAGQVLLGLLIFIAATCSFFISSDYKRADANLLKSNGTNYGSVADDKLS